MVSLSIGAMVGALLTYLGMVLGYVVRERVMRETVERMNALKQRPLTEAEKWQAENALIAAHRVSPKYEAVKLENGMIYPPLSGSQTEARCTHQKYDTVDETAVWFNGKPAYGWCPACRTYLTR